jgi:hypothetical protein
LKNIVIQVFTRIICCKSPEYRMDERGALCC